MTPTIPAGQVRLPERDAQRSKVYEAENLVHRIFARATEFPTIEVAGSYLTLPVERRFASLESVQAYVDAVLTLNWVRQRWPRAATPITVRERAGHGSANYQRLGAVLAVPGATHGIRWAMRELVILHEVSHHLEPDGLAAAHGPSFVGRLVDLVGEIVGAEAGFVLRIELLECGVRMS